MARKLIDQEAIVQLLHKYTGHGRMKQVAKELGLDPHTVFKYAKLNQDKFPPNQYLGKEEIRKKREAKVIEQNGVSIKVLRREKDCRIHLLNHARARARTRGIEFDLELSDIVIPDYCPVLGIPLAINRGSGCHDDSPSLDRIDNTRGYFWDNVLVISGRANRLKNDSTPEELVKLANFYTNLSPLTERNPVIPGKTRFSRKLTDQQEIEIKQLRSNDVPVSEIAKQYNISVVTVGVILRGRPKREYAKKAKKTAVRDLSPETKSSQ